MTYILDGMTVNTSAEGYLINPEQWNIDIANVLARQDKIDLTDAHWNVINFIRQYYAEFGIAPAIRVMMGRASNNQSNTKSDMQHLYNFFPCDIARQGCRYAGLPNSIGCL